MLDEDRIMSLTFLSYNGEMSGDHFGMRYMLRKIGEKPDLLIEATVWPEPLSFNKVDENLKIKKEFEFSEDGRTAAIKWLKAMYEEKKETWDNAPRL